MTTDDEKRTTLEAALGTVCLCDGSCLGPKALANQLLPELKRQGWDIVMVKPKPKMFPCDHPSESEHGLGCAYATCFNYAGLDA